MRIRRRMLTSPPGRVRSLRGNSRTPPSSRNRFPANRRNFRIFGKLGEIPPGSGKTPPGKGPRGRENTPPGSDGGSKGPPRGRGGGTSSASPEPNRPNNSSSEIEAALRRKQLIRRRWRNVGIAAGVVSVIASIPVIGWLLFRGSPKPIEPVNPISIEQHDPSRNGRRIPVDDFPSSNRRPIDMRPNETQREYDARKEAERRAEIERNKPPKTTRPSEKAEKFYPEKLSRQFTDQYIDFMKKVGGNVSEINWNKKVWPDGEKTFEESVKNNHVIEVTRTVNVNGNETQQSMYIYVQKDPQTGEAMFFAHGPMTNSKEWNSGEYAPGQSNPTLENLLHYLGNPTVTGVYGPKN